MCLLIIGHCFYCLEGLEENDFANDGKPCPLKIASCKKILIELAIRDFFLMNLAVTLCGMSCLGLCCSQSVLCIEYFSFIEKGFDGNI